MTDIADSGMPESHAFGRWRFDANTGDLFDVTSPRKTRQSKSPFWGCGVGIEAQDMVQSLFGRLPVWAARSPDA
jgi:hypothetical protein